MKRIHGVASGKVAQTMKRIMRACDAAMPKRRVLANCQLNYWWNEEIAELHAACFPARKTCQWSRRRPDFNEKLEVYTNFQGRLKQAMRTKKRECFRELWAEKDRNPWRAPYKVAMKRMRRQTSQQNCPHLLFDIAMAVTWWRELAEICRRIGDIKATGLDAAPNRPLKVAVRPDPRSLSAYLSVQSSDLRFTCILAILRRFSAGPTKSPEFSTQEGHSRKSTSYYESDIWWRKEL